MTTPPSALPPQRPLELQLDWDFNRLHDTWRDGPDNAYLMRRLADVPTEVTAAGGTGRVLEVAAAEAIHSCKLSLRGMESVVVEPSPAMLERARQRIAEHGARVALVRGIAETLPFPAQTFDRVLLDSAIDHLAEPELSVREMTRTLRPDGRLVISFVNYASASARLSRRLYGAARLLGLSAADRHLFWDSPVPIEHTFECTLPVLRGLCAPHLELDHAFGISLGWMVPGWGPALARLPARRALGLLRRLDRVAYRRPDLADVVFTVWRPRATPAPRPAAAGNFVVQPTDVVYPSRAQAEADYWARADFGGGIHALLRSGERQTNAAYTGDPDRSWLDDLIARGPFEHAAQLGCDEDGHERQWLQCGSSQTLDIYELSRGVIRKVRAGLGLGWTQRRSGRVRFIRTDLNFAALPANTYDVIWSSGCLHHIINLEHLFDQVARALRPGGLFALRDYVGERRMQFAPARLARINALLAEVPAEFRRIERVEPAPLNERSPFCGVRSNEILGLAEARFELVHKGVSGALFPLTLAVDIAAIERAAPALAARLEAEELAAQRGDASLACGAYAVFRKRAS
ncbi:MAG: methyltransferase domain-containing protein [Candidatus Binatia bacterium]